jgi:hypothetical protein
MEWNPAAMDKVKQDMKTSCSIFFVQHKELNQQLIGDAYLALTSTAEPLSLRESLVQSQLAVFSPDIYEAGKIVHYIQK